MQEEKLSAQAFELWAETFQAHVDAMFKGLGDGVAETARLQKETNGRLRGAERDITRLQEQIKTLFKQRPTSVAAVGRTKWASIGTAIGVAVVEIGRAAWPAISRLLGGA